MATRKEVERVKERTLDVSLGSSALQELHPRRGAFYRGRGGRRPGGTAYRLGQTRRGPRIDSIMDLR